jgi:hypothetical protein
MKGLNVVINSRLLQERTSDETYGEWYSEYKNTLAKIKFTESAPDVVTSLDVSVGDKLYIVWIEWSSGDSFGTSIRGNVETLGVFKDEQYALRFSEFVKQTDEIEESLRLSSSTISVQYLRDKFKKEFPKFDNVEINLVDNNKLYSWDNGWRLTYKTECGQSIEFRYFPWVGYFETLEDVNVDYKHIT